MTTTLAAIKERPILFSGAMVRAILDGSKTQTRRVIKSQPSIEKDVQTVQGELYDRLFWSKHGSKSIFGDAFFSGNVERFAAWMAKSGVCPYGKAGDRLIPSILLEGYDTKYCADVFGRIWSKSSGEWRLLKVNQSSGYERLTLRRDGKDTNRCVHKIVCEAFYGKPTFEKAVVRHLDGDPINNAPDNLDWGTYSQNWDDRKFHGNGINEHHHNAKLTRSIAAEIRASGKTAWALAKNYDLSPKTISRVLRDQTWVERHTETPPNMPRAVSRITLEVTEVRVQRLQDISEEDAIAEGVERLDDGWRCYGNCKEHVTGYDKRTSAKASFMSLWDSINGTKHLWDSNPWVWAVSFQRVEVSQ